MYNVNYITLTDSNNHVNIHLTHDYLTTGMFTTKKEARAKEGANGLASLA